jgi:HK97 gp10 family phage protein
LSVEFSLEIDVQDFAEKMRKLDRVTQESVQQALMSIAEEVVLRARQLAPVRTGRLVQSIFAQVLSNWVVKIGCYVPYALFQEFGTRYIHPRYFLTRALAESASKLLSAISLALQRAADEASSE